ncbi:MAG: hypothetical protein GY948_25345 [Alphaproteobacteria bacterium]|nr:hypothetical protein [Alphaproteobacteria bacterium]
MNYKRVQNIEADLNGIEEIQPKGVSIGIGKPEWNTSQITEQLRAGIQVFEHAIAQPASSSPSRGSLGEGGNFTPLNALALSTGSSWSTQADPENAARQMSREEGTNDGGERWVTITDVEDTESWTSYTNTFNLKGEQRQQDGEFDNGQTWQHIWGLDSGAPWFRLTTTNDVSDITWWSSTTHFINDDGETFAQFGTKDNGESWHHNFDVDERATWARLTDHIDAEGRILVD